MDEERFKKWLRLYNPENTANSRFSNCQRIELFEGDLDNHFLRDQGRVLIEKLRYTTDDRDMKRPPEHRIPINGNILTGTATLKQAAKLYFSFKSGGIHQRQNTNHERRPRDARVNPNPRVPAHTWPTWAHPLDKELYETIKLTAKYIKFLNPDIIKAIVADNQEHRNDWSDLLKLKGINPEIYLWDNSPCAFPGVRRYAGSREIAFFRGHTQLNNGEIANALLLDDNDFPKHIWAFVFTRKKFRKFGPENYALAHLADHKEYNNRLQEDFITGLDAEHHPLFGLYTCPTNTVYIPTNLIRPTDFSPIIRHIIFQKAFDLYGGFCNLLPPWLTINTDHNEQWKVSNFDWAEPVGDLENMEQFLIFRSKTMESLFVE